MTLNCTSPQRVFLIPDTCTQAQPFTSHMLHGQTGGSFEWNSVNTGSLIFSFWSFWILSKQIPLKLWIWTFRLVRCIFYYSMSSGLRLTDGEAWRHRGSVVSIALHKNFFKKKREVLGPVCVGLLWAPFKIMLGEFPVSGLERNTDSKRRKLPSWVLHGVWTQPFRGIRCTRYPGRLTSWGLGNMGDIQLLQKHADSCTLLLPLAFVSL